MHLRFRPNRPHVAAQCLGELSYYFCCLVLCTIGHCPTWWFWPPSCIGSTSTAARTRAAGCHALDAQQSAEGLCGQTALRHLRPDLLRGAVAAGAGGAGGAGGDWAARRGARAPVRPADGGGVRGAVPEPARCELCCRWRWRPSAWACAASAGCCARPLVGPHCGSGLSDKRPLSGGRLEPCGPPAAPSSGRACRQSRGRASSPCRAWPPLCLEGVVAVAGSAGPQVIRTARARQLRLSGWPQREGRRAGPSASMDTRSCQRRAADPTRGGTASQRCDAVAALECSPLASNDNTPIPHDQQLLPRYSEPSCSCHEHSGVVAAHADGDGVDQKAAESMKQARDMPS
jgi:hypothetical protein